jgi:hypothetical protein
VVDNLFDFEDEIASRVAGALRPSIWDAEIALARRKRPENMAAYDLVIRALPHLWAHRREDNDEAIASTRRWRSTHLCPRPRHRRLGPRPARGL